MEKHSSEMNYRGKSHKDIYYKRYHSAMFKGPVPVWYKIVGDFVYRPKADASPSGGGGVSVIDYKFKNGYETTECIYFLEKGFLKMSGNNRENCKISFSENYCLWIDTAIEMEFNSFTAEAVGNSLFSYTENQVSCYDNDRKDVKTIAIDKDFKHLFLSNNSDYYFLRDKSNENPEFICFVDKKMNAETVQFPQDMISVGNKVIHRSGPVYAYKNKVYYIKRTQIKETAELNSIRYNNYLSSLDINGNEKDVGLIYSENFGYWSQNAISSNYVYVLKMGDEPQILYNGYLIKINKEEDGIAAERYSLSRFPIKKYKNGVLQEGQLIFNNINYLSDHNHFYTEEGKVKCDAAIYSTAIYEDGEYKAYGVMIRDFFESDRNFAIRYS